MILAHKQVIKGYLFFSYGSNGAGKNEFVSVYLLTASFLCKIY